MPASFKTRKTGISEARYYTREVYQTEQNRYEINILVQPSTQQHRHNTNDNNKMKTDQLTEQKTTSRIDKQRVENEDGIC